MRDPGIEERGVRYLLELGPESEREALEEEYVESDEAFEEVLDAEERLIEAWCDGALSPALVARFEAVYLARGDRRRRVELVRALVRRAALSDAGAAGSAPPRTRRPRAGVAVAALAAALVVGVLGAWLGSRRGVEGDAGLHAERDRLAAELTRRETEMAAQAERLAGLEREVASGADGMERLRAELAAARGASGVASLLLGAVTTRGDDGPPLLELAPGVRVVRLVAPVAAATAGPLAASLQSAEGVELATVERLAPRRDDGGEACVVVALDAVPLADGHHVLVLSAGAPGGGRSVVGEYAFRVARRR